MRTSTLTNWGFEFIDFEDDNGYVKKIWCSICRAHSNAYRGTLHSGHRQLVDTEAYIVGTHTVKKNNAQDHAKSAGHIAAIMAMKQNEINAKTPLAQTPIVKAVTMMDTQTEQRMCRLFDIAYTIAFAELPFADYPLLIKLEQKHGVDLGVTYANDKACASFIGEINEHLTKDLYSVSSLKPFYFALLFDDSNDKAANEKEVTSIRYVNKRGKILTRLLRYLIYAALST